MKIRLFSYCAVLAVTFAAISDEVHPDWSQLSGSVTIAAGVTNLVEEADIEHVNKLTTITFASATSAIRFTGQTAYSNVTFSGSGTIIKDSDHDWTLRTRASDSFKGHWIMKGGIVTPMVNYAFGNNDGSSGAQLWIESGATLKFLNEMKKGVTEVHFLNSTRIHIAGNGKNGKGAIWVLAKQDTNGYDFRNIILEEDATIFNDGAAYYYYHNGTLKLNGHKLTIAGTGDYYFSNCTVSGGGEFAMPASTTAGAGRTIGIRDNTLFNITDGERIKISAGNNVTLDYREQSRVSEATRAQQYALDVSGTVTIWHNHQFSPHPFGEYDDHVLDIAGPITVPESSLLRLRVSNAENCTLKVSGPISGPGNVRVYGQGRTYLTNTNNTFGGYLYVNGADGASLRLAGTNCVPNYAAVTCNVSRVTLDVNADAPGWTPDAIVKFASEATFLTNAVVSVEATKAVDSAYTISGSDWSKVADPRVPLSSDGTSTVTVATGGFDDRLYAFGAIDGTLRFTGSDPLVITNLFAAGSFDIHSQEVGTVVFDGAKAISTTNGFVTLGNQRWNTTYAKKPGYMVVTNSSLIATLASDYSSAFKQGGIFPGWYGHGLLTIEPDSVVTSNFMIAYGDAASGGAVHQRGGTVALLGARSSNHKGSAGVIGYAGYGYYELSGGTLDLFGRPCIASNSGQGILAVHGGSAKLIQHYHTTETDPWLVLANSGNGHLYIKGGNMTLSIRDIGTWG